MAVPKTYGEEHELHIHHPMGLEHQAMLVVPVIEAIANATGPHWTFDGGEPANHAEYCDPYARARRGCDYLLSSAARAYPDLGHPEICTPEVQTALEATMYDAAVDRMAVLAGDHLRQREPRPDGKPWGAHILHDNISDDGNSWANHENYACEQGDTPARRAALIGSHLASRVVIIGAGYIDAQTNAFRLSQRGHSFTTLYGDNPRKHRSMVLNRGGQDPGAPYERIQIMCGDANRAHLSTFLKVGCTQVVLSIYEDAPEMLESLELRHAPSALRAVSEDPSLQALVHLEDGRRMKALDLQEALWEKGMQWGSRFGWDSVGGAQAAMKIMHEWRRAIDLLRNDPALMKFELDWCARKHLMDTAICKLGFGDPRVRGYVRSYGKCDDDPKISMFARLPMRELVSPEAVAHAMTAPPTSTRAGLRMAMVLSSDGNAIGAGWNYVYTHHRTRARYERIQLPPGPAVNRAPTYAPMTGETSAEIFESHGWRHQVEPLHRALRGVPALAL